MGLSLRPAHWKRYRDIAWLLMKYGRSDLVRKAGLEEALDDSSGGDIEDARPQPEDLSADLEKMGPTFIKLGQLLASRADLLPVPYLEALSRLQDRVEPFAYQEVEQIVSSEIGVRLSKAFSDFDPTPLAAASLGQVHRAALRDGRPVAVKVQRPGIRERMVDDLDALEEVANFLDQHTETGEIYEFGPMIEELRKSLLRELDYRLEAQNLIRLSDNLKQFAHLVIPTPIEDYTTSRVLTMEFIKGKKITLLGPLGRLEIDGSILVEELFRAYLQQILVDGFFHADPHPGNVFLTTDGRIALLDLGMVAHTSPGTQENLLKLLLAISDGRSDDASTIAIQIGEQKSSFDESSFRRRIAELITRNQDARLEEIDVGKVVLEVCRACGENGIRVPQELTMLGKTLLNLDEVGRTLDSKFDPNEAIRQNAMGLTRQRMMKSLSLGSIFQSMLEVKDFTQRLPQRINKILDALAHDELKVHIDVHDRGKLMHGAQKVANRITIGLILAALIIGAALLMRVETSFRILGYPGLAIIFFLAAAAGGIALVLTILFYDETPNRKAGRR
ncbi:MAG TPA: AarF/UbiB family protein [Acidobacteriota bacterium]|jgi:predicted unusual protein kinase regulating ubiquinone biosynthesis (AarF/ABC1/UbiB family)